MSLQGVILAGGKGTRLREITGDLPKPLMDIAGKPLLVRQLELLRDAGIIDVMLLTGYRSAAIKDVVGDGSQLGLHLAYHEEDEENPLGTAGALLSSVDKLKDQIVVLYGDCVLNVDLARFASWHQTHGSEVSLLTHPNSHPEDSDLVEADGQGRVRAFHPYPHDSTRFLPNQVNAALYIIDTKVLAPYRNWHGIARPDIAKHLFPAMLNDGRKLFAYSSPEYIKDAGTPKRYTSVVRDWNSGRIARSSLVHRQKAIFLDRDGTLNVEVNRVSTPSALALIDGVAEAVHLINDSEYRAIVLTNQPVLARGDCDEVTLGQIHAKLDTLLGCGGAYLDRIYYCPHHPDKGFLGEISALKIDCACRKPKTGMIETAAADFNIDLSKSWMVGDTTVDIAMAKNAGVKSILLQTGQAGADGRYCVTPDYLCGTLREAVALILEKDSPALSDETG